MKGIGGGPFTDRPRLSPAGASSCITRGTVWGDLSLASLLVCYITLVISGSFILIITISKHQGTNNLKLRKQSTSTAIIRKSFTHKSLASAAYLSRYPELLQMLCHWYVSVRVNGSCS